MGSVFVADPGAALFLYRLVGSVFVGRAVRLLADGGVGIRLWGPYSRRGGVFIRGQPGGRGGSVDRISGRPCVPCVCVCPVTVTFAEIVSRALQLPSVERAALAQKLLESLDEAEAVAEAWAEVAAKRSRELVSGEAESVAAADVLSEARRTLRTG